MSNKNKTNGTPSNGTNGNVPTGSDDEDFFAKASERLDEQVNPFKKPVKKEDAEVIDMRDEELEKEHPLVLLEKSEVLKKNKSGEESKNENPSISEKVEFNRSTLRTSLDPSTAQLTAKELKQLRRNNEAMWDACESGDSEKLLKLLNIPKENFPPNLNAKSLDDWTALHFAANYGRTNVIPIILENGGQIDANTKMKRTPLHIACIKGHLNAVQSLVDRGANINAKDIEFNTPLHFACEHGFCEIVEYLLTKSPNINIKNSNGLTCFYSTLDISIWKVFEEKGLIGDDITEFGRQTFDGFVICRARADLVGKLLSTTSLIYKAAELKKKESEKIKTTVTNVQIQDVSATGAARIGPKDFKYHMMLGQGSFGKVFLVEKIDTKKLYAMKTLDKKFVMAKEKDISRYAKAERNVLIAMNHPFIVKLHFAFQNDEKLFLVMDYCSGGTLLDVIDSQGTLSENVAKIYAAEIILALESLHEKDIIFRDLKPENVLIDFQGHALLTDFGLAKEGVKEDMTTNSFCGSVAYLAPEILSKMGHNKTVDWYLLGVLIYEMLVGSPPYFDNNRKKLFQNILKGELVLPNTLSMEAKDLIAQLLIRNPKKRLGNKNDAYDIKNHAWLRSMDWKKAMDRKLKPLPAPKKPPKLDANGKKETPFFEDSEKKNRLDGWSFVNPDWKNDF